MIRRLLNLLTALSLVLCVVVGVMWVRSYWASASLVRRQGAVEGGETRNVVWDLHSTKGGIVFHYSQVRTPVAALTAPVFAQYVSERVLPGPGYRGSTVAGIAWDPYAV